MNQKVSGLELRFALRLEEYGNPCQSSCPAEVCEMVENP